MMHTHCCMSEPPTQTPPQPVRRYDCARTLTLLLVAAAIALCLILPGDVPINDDQVWMLITAAKANASHKLVQFGLSGGMFGLTYGPVPTQIYQILFLVTHDLRLFIFLRAMLVTLTIAAAMWSLAKSLNLPRWFIAIVLASPWVWYFCRDPWDNNFSLPVGCLLLLAYLRWLQKQTRWRAIAWAALATLLPLLHLSALPLAIAVFGHALTRQSKLFRPALPWVLAGVLLACSTSGPWLWFLSQRFVERAQLRLAGYDSSPGAGYEKVEHPSSRETRLVSMTYAFRQATLLTADQDFAARRGESGTEFLAALRPAAKAPHLWLAVGIICVVQLLRRSPSEPVAAMGAVALTALLVQALIFFVMRIEWHEHYFNGTFASMALICWIGVAKLWKHRAARWLLVILPALTMIASTIVIVSMMHARAQLSPPPRHVAELMKRSG